MRYDPLATNTPVFRGRVIDHVRRIFVPHNFALAAICASMVACGGGQEDISSKTTNQLIKQGGASSTSTNLTALQQAKAAILRENLSNLHFLDIVVDGRDTYAVAVKASASDNTVFSNPDQTTYPANDVFLIKLSASTELSIIPIALLHSGHAAIGLAQNGTISVFINYLEGNGTYGMGGTLYTFSSLLRPVESKKLFSDSNYGWFPYFDAGGHIHYFSYAGYYGMIDGQYLESISPSTAEATRFLNQLSVSMLMGESLFPQSDASVVDKLVNLYVDSDPILPGPRASYLVEITSSGVKITGQGNIVIYPFVRRITFSDGILALDIDGKAGNAYHLYRAAFAREPDTAGLSFWMQKLDEGITLEAVAGAFIDSAEFKSLNAGVTDQPSFIKALYQNVLGRAPDSNGLQWWINALSNGFSHASTLVQFSESDENISNTSALIKQGIFLSHSIAATPTTPTTPTTDPTPVPPTTPSTGTTTPSTGTTTPSTGTTTPSTGTTTPSTGTTPPSTSTTTLSSINVLNFAVSTSSFTNGIVPYNNVVVIVKGTLPEKTVIDIGGMKCNEAAPVTATALAKLGAFSSNAVSYLGADGYSKYRYPAVNGGITSGFASVCLGAALTVGQTLTLQIKSASGNSIVLGSYKLIVNAK